MKTSLLLLPLLVLATGVNANPIGPVITWRTMLQQTQVNGAVGAPVLVNHKGSGTSLPIGNDGSRFKIWGWKFSDGVLVSETELDSTEVNTYLPQAEIEITTLDPFTGFKRSRVDQPFSVTFTISGLKSADPTAPASAKKVQIDHYADVYAGGTYSGDQVDSETLIQRFYVNENGKTTISFPNSNLPAADLARSSGRERFIVYAMEDGATPTRAIATATVQMYPVTEGKFFNLDDSVAYKTIPDFVADIVRAYPGSSTWVEIYKGGYSPGTRGPKFPNTLELPSKNEPAAFTKLIFDNFPPELYPRESGQYTFVLRSSSPFPGESIEEGGAVLDQQTLDFQTSLTINTMMTTIE